MQIKITSQLRFGIILLLAACEGGTTFTKTIENKSSESITVVLFTTLGEKNEAVINPNTTKEIYWNDMIGSFVDNTHNCTTLIDSIYLGISNNKVLTKDIMNAANWDRASAKGRNAREDCTFTIYNTDLQ